MKSIFASALVGFFLLSCAAFAQMAPLEEEGAPEPSPTASVEPTATPSPTPTAAPPGCVNGRHPSGDPSLPCTVVVTPLEQVSQRVQNLENGQREIINWINTQQRRVEAEAAAKAAEAPKKK